MKHSINVQRALALAARRYMEEAHLADSVLIDMYPMEIVSTGEVVVDIDLFDCIAYSRYTLSFRYDIAEDILTGPEATRLPYPTHPNPQD